MNPKKIKATAIVSLLLLPLVVWLGIVVYKRFFIKNESFDFSNTVALQSTCTEVGTQDPGFFSSDHRKLAVVVCRGVELLKKEMTFLRTLRRESDENAIKAARQEAETLLAHLTESQKILEKVDLSQKAFVIALGNWELDLDGDGKIDDFEKHFFWLPKPGIKIPRRPWDETERLNYYQTYFQKVQIKIDASDVDWALAYLNLGEMILNTALGYDLRMKSIIPIITLKDSKRVNQAYQHALEAVAYSKKMRASIQKETSDELEWIPNPRQKNTAFPITMDEELFQTWGFILEDLESLLEGKALWGGAIEAKNGQYKRALLGNFCPADQGINVKELFNKPLDFAKEDLTARCQKVTEQLPLSRLTKTLSAVYERNLNSEVDEFDLMRYLYWVN